MCACVIRVIPQDCDVLCTSTPSNQPFWRRPRKKKKMDVQSSKIRWELFFLWKITLETLKNSSETLPFLLVVFNTPLIFFFFLLLHRGEPDPEVRGGKFGLEDETLDFVTLNLCYSVISINFFFFLFSCLLTLFHRG